MKTYDSALMHPRVKRLWETAQAEGLSPEKLAPIIGVAFNTVYNWLRGRKPLPAHEILIADYIYTVENKKRKQEGLPEAAIWTGGDEPNPDEEEFNKNLSAFFENLGRKVAGTIDSEIFYNPGYQSGFEEILWLAKKHGVKLPKGIL